MNASVRALQRSFAAPAYLLDYRAEQSPAARAFKYLAFFTLCVFSGLVYGFALAIFPPQLFVFLAIPVLALALLAIWALPEIGRMPTRALSALLFAYFLICILWPNYLAIQLPGLPWISLRRLVAFPALIVFLISASVSSEFRSTIQSVCRTVWPINICIVVFTIVQVLTIPASRNFSAALNGTLNFIFLYTSVFYAAIVIFSAPRRVERLITLILAATALILAIAAAEYVNGQVLWANHIPSFLQIENADLLQGYLSSATRDGVYRTAATFSNALCLGEFLAIITPFVIHRVMSSADLKPIVFWSAYDLALLGGIVLTQSRLGILGWCIAHAFYGCMWSYRRWRRFTADLISPAVALIYPAFAAFIFVGMFTIPAIRNRTIGGGSTGFSDDARQVQFHMLWPKVFHNPFGYGSGSSGMILGYTNPNGQITVDSYIITMFIDHGVIGFLTFFGMLVFAVFKLSEVYWKSQSKHVDLSLPLASTMLVILQVRAVLSQEDNMPLVYLFLGIASVLIWESARPKVRESLS